MPNLRIIRRNLSQMIERIAEERQLAMTPRLGVTAHGGLCNTFKTHHLHAICGVQSTFHSWSSVSPWYGQTTQSWPATSAVQPMCRGAPRCGHTSLTATTCTCTAHTSNQKKDSRKGKTPLSQSLQHTIPALSFQHIVSTSATLETFVSVSPCGYIRFAVSRYIMCLA